MAKKTKNSPAAKRIVAIELLSSELLAVIVEPGAEGKATVKARRTTWRREAATLRSEQGQQELTDALKKLADEENLRDASIRLAARATISASRVVSGEQRGASRAAAFGRRTAVFDVGRGREGWYHVHTGDRHEDFVGVDDNC
ncbi:MAG: hypothetical protein R3C99_15215 [Pirellulaceae bacterium]